MELCGECCYSAVAQFNLNCSNLHGLELNNLKARIVMATSSCTNASLVIVVGTHPLMVKLLNNHK